MREDATHESLSVNRHKEALTYLVTQQCSDSHQFVIYLLTQ